MPVTESQRKILEALSRSATAPHREVVRAAALLLAADGVANTAIAARLGVSPSSVRAWRDRFAAQGVTKFGQVAPCW
ncbi:MAG: helix-turn-helix domain-containing protein [Pseudonocardiales bacterium]|nr:helix-turn-helix domain-containing protein [Pseudonocardiales bacterium]